MKFEEWLGIMQEFGYKIIGMFPEPFFFRCEIYLTEKDEQINSQSICDKNERKNSKFNII